MKTRHPPASLPELARLGFWYCNLCEKVTEPSENHTGANACPLCGTQAITWHPPAYGPERHTRKLLVQIEYDETTRWLCRDQELADFLATIARNIMTAHTTGAQPAVTVTVEEETTPTRTT